MPRWLKIVSIGVGLLAVVFVVVGVLLPDDYTVRRSVTIESDPEDIHVYVGDLTKWNLWVPWKEDDPSLVVSLGEKTQGIGASQSWVGKDGDGSLEFTASSARRGVEYDLYFDEGKYKSRSALRYRLDEENTHVSWILKGRVETPVLGGYLAAMMDSMVGVMFERGLQNLKRIVEKVDE